MLRVVMEFKGRLPNKMVRRHLAASAELLGGQWELCLPQTKLLHLTLSPAGEMVPSHQAVSGLEAQWDGSVRCKRWSVRARPEDAQALDVDIRRALTLPSPSPSPSP